MRLTVEERKKATAIVTPRYQKARKKDKRLILDEFTKLTGYGRRYASYVLRGHGRKVRINETTVLQGDIRKRNPRRKPFLNSSYFLLKSANIQWCRGLRTPPQPTHNQLICYAHTFSQKQTPISMMILMRSMRENKY